jgi:hydrogenase nickel incorporation protein HypA/HybF
MLSLCKIPDKKIFKIVLAEANAHQAKQIKKVKIAVGELSGIVNSSVEFYFGMLAKKTIAEHAILDFVRVPARLFCIHCNKEFDKEARDFTCPDCGNLARLTETGQECIIESIEVD